MVYGTLFHEFLKIPPSGPQLSATQLNVRSKLYVSLTIAFVQRTDLNHLCTWPKAGRFHVHIKSVEGQL